MQPRRQSLTGDQTHRTHRQHGSLARAESETPVIDPLGDSKAIAKARSWCRNGRADLTGHLPSVSRLILLWAFWFWSGVEPAQTEDGWVVMATRNACETAREYVYDLAAIYGVVSGVGGCHHMTPEELNRKRHEPPADAPRFIPNF